MQRLFPFIDTQCTIKRETRAPFLLLLLCEALCFAKKGRTLFDTVAELRPKPTRLILRDDLNGQKVTS